MERTAIISGVSRGIGKAIAVKFLSEGIKVAGIGLNDPQWNYPDFKFIRADVREQQQVEEAFNIALDFLGDKLDVLVNNAGLGYFKPVEDLSSEEFIEMFEVNVFGTFYLTRLAVPIMKKQGKGHIIFLGSVAALNGIAEGTGYCATKFAVRGFALSLFKEVRQFGIHVTLIHPGSVKTDFFRNFPSVEVGDWMLKPEQVARSVFHAIQCEENCNVLELELRPLILPSK
ncbi:MAG: SDR family oxidoreductase [Chlorobi bacterium]|nr:SDR family oxidoreductase [Chlorobiota bacterium]